MSVSRCVEATIWRCCSGVKVGQNLIDRFILWVYTGAISHPYLHQSLPRRCKTARHGTLATVQNASCVVAPGLATGTSRRATVKQYRATSTRMT